MAGPITTCGSVPSEYSFWGCCWCCCLPPRHKRRSWCHHTSGQDLTQISNFRPCLNTFSDVFLFVRSTSSNVFACLLYWQIKNRLDPGYDAQISAGYRDVGLNLRIGGTMAMELGVETHVCEVQLLLRPFAELKVLWAFVVNIVISP